MLQCTITAQISTTPAGLQEVEAITTTVGEVIMQDTGKSQSTVEVAAQSLAVASSKAVQIITAILAAQNDGINATYNSSTAVLEDTVRVRLLFAQVNIPHMTLASCCGFHCNFYVFRKFSIYY